MDWCRRPFENAAAAGRPRRQDAKGFKFLVGWAEKLTGACDPRHALQENGGLADFWYIDVGDILCHSILVSSYLHEFDDANDKVGAVRNLHKTEVIHCVTDLDAAPFEWKIDEVRLHASVSTVAAGSNTLESLWDHDSSLRTNS